MTRGNRQGNNAFMEGRLQNNKDPWGMLHHAEFMEKLMSNPRIEAESFIALKKLHPNFDQAYATSIVH